MKFLTTKGAPNIPLELLEAQESNSLVFFCGAGVSYAAGLPSFRDLVTKVYDRLGVSPTESENEAVKAGLFDRALGLLERRIVGDSTQGANLLRKAIIEELTIQADADLTSHKAILELSKTVNHKFRLVTTNVDHGFLLSNENVKDNIDAAPKLPIPKPHKWGSIVHLHGIINDEDQNGEQLIFTSGDFGSAYLTERWASKFVTELFTHFTVLFLGYSLNDPVIRYMTDAIAAERLRGYEGFKQPYVAAHTKPTQRAKDEESWKAKGIQPILYSFSHNNLYNTLREWGNYIRDGLNAKERIVIKVASVAPLPPYNQDSSVLQLVDILSEKTRLDHEDITGYPAKVFSELDDPPAPIEWLDVLYDKKLLSIAQEKDTLLPVYSDPYEFNLLKPNKISYNLWHWLLHHLENDTLIKWIVDHGVCLHPDLKYLCAKEISNKPPREPYLKFWKIITSDYVFCRRSLASDGYEYVMALKQCIDQLTLNDFTQLLTPLFQLTKSYNWSSIMDDKSEQTRVRNPYDIEVVIKLSDWMFEELKKMEAYPDKFISLLFPVTQNLIKALEFWSFTGYGEESFDRSHWDMVSIQDHPQNNRFRNWVILIEICRDLWQAAWEANSKVAKQVLEYWRTLKYPVFRRLLLYSMTFDGVFKIDEIVSYLIEDKGRWLWNIETHREVFRLLAVLWPKLDEANSSHLINFILSGPSKDIYRKDLSNEEWEWRFNHDIWLLLSKLKSFGRELPGNAEKVLDNISSEYPMWALSEGEQDEFTTWVETGTGFEVDINVDELFKMNVPDIIECLAKDVPRYNRGRIETFRLGCKTYNKKAVETLTYMALHNKWDGNIWHAALVGLADNCDLWLDVSKLLIDAISDLYRNESWPIAYWTKKNIASVKCGMPEEKNFWVILTRILENTPDQEEAIKRPVDYAINHPVGIITEALIERFGTCDLKTDEGIPEGSLKESLNLIIQNERQASIAGKIILASRLNYFFSLDPEWTKERLLVLFDWEKSVIAPLVWEGYLWSPRMSADLANAIKHHLHNSLKNIDKIKDSAERLIQLFTVVCLEFTNLYTTKEQREVLTQIGSDGLVFVTDLFWRSIGKDKKSADNYWQNRVYPFMKGSWPTSGEFVTEKSSEKLALMLINLDSNFKNALDFLWPYIKPFNELSRFLTFLKTKEILKTRAREVFKLLSKIFIRNYQWPTKTFREVLNAIVASDPSIKSEIDYRRMDDFLIAHNL